jgi:hypothetical protein
VSDIGALNEFREAMCGCKDRLWMNWGPGDEAAAGTCSGYGEDRGAFAAGDDDGPEQDDDEKGEDDEHGKYDEDESSNEYGSNDDDEDYYEEIGVDIVFG